MFVGIDFGTSNSSIGVYRDNQLRLFDLDPGYHNPQVLPSYTYITKEQEVFVGVTAINKYLEQETGRRPLWEKRYLGETQITVSGGKNPIVYMHDIMVDIDIVARGRLMHSIKTGLQNPSYEGTQVFDQYFRIEDLIAILLRQLREKCEQSLQTDVDQVVMGRPVKFSDKPEVDARAQEKLETAARLAGFKDIAFELEPIGGAYLYHQTQPTHQNILVFDFGGGTLDMTVMEVGGDQAPRTIATEGVLLGGDDLTSAMMGKLVNLFGQGASLKNGLPIPSHIFEKLYNWKNMVELSKPEYSPIFKEAKEGSDPQGIERLEKLVQEKLGFTLFQELERIKINLSSEYYNRFEFFDGALKISELFFRSHFEDLIQDELRMVDQAVDSVMAKSGLKDDRIQAVLRTGGSAEIPIFIERLSARFGPDRIKEINPFTTIVGGLALKGHELALA